MSCRSARASAGRPSGFLSHVIGGWRISAIQIYSSGMPIASDAQQSAAGALFNGQNRPVIDSYDNWRAPISGDKFDPNVDRFLKPANRVPGAARARFRQRHQVQPEGSQLLESG